MSTYGSPREDVKAYLGGSVGDYDLEGILDVIHSKGIDDIDDMDQSDFIDVIKRHDISKSDGARHYYGIWHAYDERTISDGDRLYVYDTLAELTTAIDKGDGYEHGATTRCTRDYARKNFDLTRLNDTFDCCGDNYAPAKGCYTE